MAAPDRRPGRQPVIVAAPFVWEGGRGRGKPTVHLLLEGLARHGYEVHVVTGTNRPSSAPATADGYRVHHVHLPVVPVRFGFDVDRSFLTRVRGEPRGPVRHAVFRTWWLQFVALCGVRAVRLARRIRPAFAYGINNPGVPVAFGAGRATGAPTVARVMGTEIAQFAGVDLDSGTGGLSRDGSEASAAADGAPSRPRPASLPSPFRRLALWTVRFDELLAFRLPCAAWFVTDDGQIGRRTLVDWLGVPEERLFLWRNGVDKARFARAPDRRTARAALGIAPDEKVVLWVSQLTDWKHPERLLDAAPAVLREVPEARFLFVGDGPERAALERRADRPPLAGRVRFEGFVAHERVPAYYRAADAFVALYDRANVSNTLLEAMLAGVAVVALDNGLTREAVRHEHTGLLVPAHRPGDVAGALSALLRDDALRSGLAAAAARWAEDSLPTWQERIDHEIAVIQDLVARGRDSRAAGGTQGS